MKKALLLAITFIVMITACSKDDDSSNPVIEEGGEVFTSQVVTISLPDTDLTQNEYQGTFGGVPVTIIKGEDNTLLFVVPADALGNGDLVIASLNVTIHYNAQQTVLPESAEQVIGGLTANFDSFRQTLDDSSDAVAVSETLNSFESYIANATDAEKIELATVYYANKASIDNMILADYTVQGRNLVTDTRIFINKHKAAILALGVGCAIVTTAPVIGIPLMAVGAYKAYKANTEAIENVLSTINLKVSSWFGSNNRGIMSNNLTVKHNTVMAFPFSLSERKLTQSDASGTEPYAVEYFTSHNLYNSYANITNSEIDETNEAKGTDFNDVPLQQLAASNPTVLTEVNDAIYENVTFSLNHPNLVLESAELAADGQLKIKVKVTGTPTALPIETTLNYNYDDDFSAFSGSFPLTVEVPLEGTWTLESFAGGTPIGQYANNGNAVDCPGIVTNQYTMQSYALVFGETEYTATGVEIYRDLNLTWNSSCTVTANDADEYETVNHNESGTYSLDGNSITLSTNGNSVSATVTYIGANKIEIDGQVYNRQL